MTNPTKKFKSRPPHRAVEIDDFIAGAEKQPEETKAPGKPVQTEAYPWEAPGVRADVLKVFNLRLPEPYLLKLKYISEHTPQSMHKFCQAVLLEAIDEKILELIGGKSE